MAIDFKSPASIFAFLWAALKAIQIIVFGFLSLIIIVALLVVIGSQETVQVPDGGALLLNPGGSLVEQKSALDPAQLLQTGQLPKEALVKDIIDALALARHDDRIKLLVLDLEGLKGGLMPKLERIARAIADFKDSGKKVVAIANNYNQSAILLAAQADEVLMNPEGSALPEGFGMYRTYYKTLLDNFDVSINLFKVGKYKSAVEPLFRDSMSDEDKEARLGILNNWWSAYTKTVETSRNLPAGSLDQQLNDASNQLKQAEGNLGRLALDMGLVDRLLTSDELRRYLIELAGEDEETGQYRKISYTKYLSVARKPEPEKSNKVAVITAVGSIVDGNARAGSIGSASLTKLIRTARKDETVKAIVLRVDSGGGSKTASEIIRRELQSVQEAGIPVVASMGSVAASGGYWISATADEIWALPTTLTGSIGIFGLLPTFEKTLARYGVHGDGVGTTPIVGGFSIERGVTPLFADIMQQVIEAGYQQFLETVAKGRKMSTDAVHEIAQGRIWSGEMAKKLGLVDRLGDLEQAIESAAGLAGIEEYSVWYVEPEKSTKERIIEQLMAQTMALRPDPGLNPLSTLMRQIQTDLNFLGNLNDPLGVYVLCSSCPMDP